MILRPDIHFLGDVSFFGLVYLLIVFFFFFFFLLLLSLLFALSCFFRFFDFEAKEEGIKKGREERKEESKKEGKEMKKGRKINYS